MPEFAPLPPAYCGWVLTQAREPPQYRHGQPDTRLDGRCAADSSSGPPPRGPAVSQRVRTQKPRRRAGRLAAAESLRRRSPDLSRLSARRLRSICRVFWACDLPGRDWTPAEILAASSGGRGRPVYAPGAWVRHVLGAYLDADGRPLPPPLPYGTGLSPDGGLSAAATEVAAARAEAEAADPARAAQLRSIPLRQHGRSWRPGPRAGDPSRWAAIALAQAAESRAARVLADADGAPGEPPAAAAELAAIGRRSAADPADAARRLRALAQVAAARRQRSETS